MTHIEQAIKEAQGEGGWQPRRSYRASDWATVTSNRDFWIALGQARTWQRQFAMASHGTTGELDTDGVSSYEFDGDSTEDFSLASEPTPEWKYRWHRFIDALAEGRSAEEFFSTLI